MRLALLPLLLAALFLLLGCGPREHIRPDFGKQLRYRLSMQRVYTEPTEGNPAGLDSEEATLIHGTYRKNLAKEAASSGESGKVLILQEDKDAKSK